MKRVVIIGASGMVGGYALHYLLEDPTVEAVTSIGRKTLYVSNPKLTQVVARRFRGLLGARKRPRRTPRGGLLYPLCRPHLA
jgi:nucleoside-diphosphate-sugar epimerase